MDDTSAADENQGSVLINLEGLIKSHISSIDRLQDEIKKNREMFDDFFNNDTTFKAHAEAAKAASKIKNATKQQILKQPAVADLQIKLKTQKSELGEMKAALSDYLQEFARMSGVNEIEGEDGEVREIVYTAKLVRRFNSR